MYLLCFYCIALNKKAEVTFLSAKQGVQALHAQQVMPLPHIRKGHLNCFLRACTFLDFCLAQKSAKRFFILNYQNLSHCCDDTNLERIFLNLHNGLYFQSSIRSVLHL